VSGRWAGAIGFAVCALALAACGGSSKGGASTHTGVGRPVQIVVVDETEFRLRPSTTRLTAGKTYEFEGVNKGKIRHALEIDGPGIAERTKTIEPGGSEAIQVTLGNPGTYSFYCPLDGHRQKGMLVRFVVRRG
jgi:uncharacterized cupredoxin-like copper-binding protein